MLNDERVDDFVEDVGRRWSRDSPASLRHPEFRYTFDVVNQKEINAFALPGGPMFLNRGMIEAAKTEGEVAGVMAHEISHVALRHGTAQATKGQKFQIGAIAGQMLGAIVGGTAGGVISQGSQFGLGTYFLKYSREYECQADLLGAQIHGARRLRPARDGQHVQDHRGAGRRQRSRVAEQPPEPGQPLRRHQPRKPAMLRVRAMRDTGQFQSIQARLAGCRRPTPPSRSPRVRPRPAPDPSPPRAARVDWNRPRLWQTYQPSDFLRISVPANWDSRRSGDTVMFVPDGGYVQRGQRQSAFTHGIEVGVTREATATCSSRPSSCSRDSPSRIRSCAPPGVLRTQTIGGRQGLTTTLSNVCEVTGAPKTSTSRRRCSATAACSSSLASPRSVKRRCTRTHSDAFGSQVGDRRLIATLPLPKADRAARDWPAPRIK